MLLDVVAGPDARDRTSSPASPTSYAAAIEQLEVNGLRATWSSDLGFVTVDREVSTLAERAATTLATAAGLSFTDVVVQLDDFIGIYAFMEAADGFVDVPPDWEQRLDELDPLVVAGWHRAAETRLPRFATVERNRRRVVTFGGLGAAIDRFGVRRA